MCYIIGGYVLNRYIELYGKKNIKKIIYDRSPTQERAARIGVDKLPFFTRLKYGQLVFDFSEVKLKSIENKFDIKVGVIIENQATRLMRFFESHRINMENILLTYNKLKKIMMIFFIHG